MRIRPPIVLMALVVLAVVLVGCSGKSSGGGLYGGSSSTTGGGSTGTGSSTAGVTITEQNFAFNPANITAKVGDTVTFVNNDSTTHNVKIDGKELGPQNQGESKTWTASKAGSFPYNCIIHPSMTGEITVK